MQRPDRAIRTEGDPLPLELDLLVLLLFYFNLVLYLLRSKRIFFLDGGEVVLLGHNIAKLEFAL